MEARLTVFLSRKGSCSISGGYLGQLWGGMMGKLFRGWFFCVDHGAHISLGLYFSARISREDREENGEKNPAKFEGPAKYKDQ